ncbi:MAG TPA: prenyltransferase/squalene oxidase repeat-containing protein [Solirubrobacterales bacterium]|nr:prenyltransferase/squalene oxidase repeat-containing protein [Solirubrobacterales bacterium]
MAALGGLAGSAGAYVTPAQAEHAADRGAGWFETNQQQSGELGGDWAMTALAAAGTNSADVRTSLADPSAQDFYLGEWQASGPGGAGTDAERGILAGVAGGLQTSRLSTAADTTKSNLVARVAELFDGTQIGEPGLLNDDIFGVLALHQAGAPPELLRRLVDYLRTKQLPDGGWSWNASPGAPADTDMTGSVVAAFCAAGVGPGDTDLDQALDLLHSLQDPATGGFIAPPESFGVGLNTDTTSWVISGLIQCGIDPQGPEWTTAQGKTPLDYLLSMQRSDGHFDWTDEYAGGSFETYSSVRPLGGVAFSSAPPARLDGASPAVRPAPEVADGTTVPITLVIDHGPGAHDVRMCRVDVEDGSGLGAVLADAKAASTPGSCVSEFATGTGAVGTEIASLDGVATTPDYGWRVGVDGSAARTESSESIGFGDLVFLKYEATVADPGPAPKVAVAPVEPVKRRVAPGARISIRGEARWSDGAIEVEARCPRGLGAGGCRGLLSARFRKHRGGHLIAAGSAAFELSSGSGGTVRLPATEALRRQLAQRHRLKLRLTGATRAEDGAIRLTHAKRFIAG